MSLNAIEASGIRRKQADDYKLTDELKRFTMGKMRAAAVSFFGLDSEAVNKGRQKEMDIVKGMAIIFMIVDHAYGMISYAWEGSVLLTVLDEILAGYLAAPLFMLCMGIGFAYSKNQAAGRLAVRGGKILIMGVALNFFRYIVPYFVSFLLGKPLLNNGWYIIMRTPGEIDWLNTLVFILQPDILLFAGLTMLAFALFRKLKLRPFLIFMISIIASIAAGLIGYTESGNPFIDMILAFFLDTQWSYFPLLVWLVFPAFGYCLGNLLLHCRDKEVFYKRALSFSLPVTGIYTVICHLMSTAYPFSFGNSEYYMSCPDALFTLAIGLTAISVCYFISKSERIRITMLQRFSSNITVMFNISWILIAYIATAMIICSPYYAELPTVLDDSAKQLYAPWVGIVIGIVLIFVTDRLTVLWLGRKTRRTER